MNTKNNVITSIIKSSLLFICIFFLQSQYAYAEFKFKTIVLDAGHGGHDAGCKGYSGHSHEKDVTLAIVLKVGKLIEQNYPNIKVIYTRKTDVFIPLEERAAIANKNKADLFVSIHCNANVNTSAYGSETFLMGLHKTEANLDVAIRENSVIKLEKDYKKTYDGFDPDSPESLIALSLAQNANIEQSSFLAGRVQNYFANDLKRFNRGVKQAGFWVLYRTTCPSILIETGFLTNPKEEKFLTSENGQNDMAESVYHAFLDYKTYIEKNPIKTNPIVVKPEPINVPTKEDTEEIKPILEAKTDTDNVKITPPIESPNSSNNVASSNGIEYKIQLTAGSTLFPQSHKIYHSDVKIHYEKIDGLYKYLTEPIDNYANAILMQAKVRKIGYSDAFITVYKDGIRLSPAESKKYLK